eukprot:3062529-Rhodomonas_salina.1
MGSQVPVEKIVERVVTRDVPVERVVYKDTRLEDGYVERERLEEAMAEIRELRKLWLRSGHGRLPSRVSPSSSLCSALPLSFLPV